MSKPLNIAILGATGAVGTELISLLEERQFPVSTLRLLSSPRSAGRTVSYKGESLVVEPVSDRSFDGIDIVLASAGGSVSKQWADTIVKAGAVMIDNSSAFRMAPHVPLIIPEINPKVAKHHSGIIANPNCTTIIMAMAVWPLHQHQPVRRILASTYQSASGAGARAMEEVKLQAQDILQGKEPRTESFPYPLAFNLFPHNSPLDADG
ncbi:MAG: aspartate-semialdehyde dehydrogenase, partial [Cyanobacteria bacterium J06626_14]